MTDQLQGRRVAFMLANEGVEQVELTAPWEAVVGAGARAELLAPEEGSAQAFNHLDKGDAFPVDGTIGEADPSDYDALVLPGGVANPDQLRTVPAAVRFVQEFFAAGKPAAVICHGPWTLVEADVVRARTLTSWPSLKTDIGNAGGNWVDREVQVCTDGPNLLITSRKPDDLPAFCAELLRALSVASHPA
ncbi:MAG TPA: type 1 glutamine amidotransferase domain-containing protein [Acidimicrobiales bacterium]|jgi:protease I|nr:type 1 glutamine amidotransferase domain-containing protein [Acidimicrobiales bacterium]